jgi:hypothetical protein
MEIKTVRVNGVALTIPADELTDPNPNAPGTGCAALEPDWPNGTGGTCCTIEAHPADVAHISHDGSYNVLAIWTTPSGPSVTITILDDDDEPRVTIPQDERRELVHADVTLDGIRAKITGYCRPYANVTAFPDGPSVEFAWSTVARVVANGGAFKS